MKNQYAKRTDGNQADIVKDLRKAGVQVILTNMGNDYPDLMLGHNGQWILVEVKQPIVGKFDRGQIKFISEAQGLVAVATSSEEALSIVKHPLNHCFIVPQKRNLAKWLIENPDQQTLNMRQFGLVSLGIEKAVKP